MVIVVNLGSVNEMLRDVAYRYGISVSDLHRSDIESMNEIETEIDNSALYVAVQEMESEAEMELNDFGFEVAWIARDEQGKKYVIIEEMVPIAPSQEMLKQLQSRIRKVMKYKMLHAYINRILGWGGPLGYWKGEEDNEIYVKVVPYDDEGEMFTLGQLWNRDIGIIKLTIDDVDETRTD